MIKNIIIIELYLVVIFLLYKLIYYIRRENVLKAKRRERITNKKGKPEMRDPILKRG